MTNEIIRQPLTQSQLLKYSELTIVTKRIHLKDFGYMKKGDFCYDYDIWIPDNKITTKVGAFQFKLNYDPTEEDYLRCHALTYEHDWGEDCDYNDVRYHIKNDVLTIAAIYREKTRCLLDYLNATLSTKSHKSERINDDQMVIGKLK